MVDNKEFGTEIAILPNMNQLHSASHLASPEPYLIHRLALENFRNYDMAEFHFEPTSLSTMMTVIIGKNGTGKTNMLEALSLLAPGRGLRPSPADEKIKFGQEHFRIRADFFYQQQSEYIKIEFHKGDGKLQSYRNHQPIKAKERNLSCLWALPRHDRLFQESPQERKRFLDRLIGAIYDNHAGLLMSLQELLRQRRMILEQGITDKTWLKILEKRIAEKSIAIASHRIAYVNKLNIAIKHGFQFLPPMSLQLSGTVEELIRQHPTADSEKIYQQYLENQRSDDTTAGVKSTDFSAEHKAKNLPAHLCSTGEQKLLVLGLMVGAVKILIAEFGRPPIFLLDDITSHLDDTNQANILSLFQLLSDELGVMCFLTGTDEKNFLPLKNRAQFITLAAGRVMV